MESLKKYFPLAFAVLFATLSSVSVYYFLKDRGNTSHAAPSGNMISIVVAKEPIPLGKKITEHDLKIVPWPQDAAPGESFQSVRPLVGRIAKSHIIENELILSTKLMSDGENFSSLIPSHMRGVTVPIRYSAALAEILERGTTVDVISMSENKPGTPTATVIAQNVRVLAVHRNLPGTDPEHEPRNMEVTLIVTPRQAEWLVAAMNQGAIQIAMRNAQEEAVESVNVGV